LKDIAYEIHVVSGNFVARLHMEIVQYVGYFTNGVQKTKILMYFIDKQVPIKEPVLKDALVFLVEAHLKCYGTLWILTFFLFLLSIFLDFIFLFF